MLTDEELRAKIDQIDAEYATKFGNTGQQPEFDDDLIPDTGGDENRTAEDAEIDTLIDGFNIIDAYNRWIGKMKPHVGRKTESIMISCPMPDHTDSNPSAWASLSKDTWFCAVCDRGGDQYDLAAIKFGFNVDTYKRDGSFPELRRQMAEDLGFTIRRTLGGDEYVERVTEEAPEAAVAGPEPDPTKPLLDFEDLAVAEGDVVIPWQEIVAPNTFLHHWMEATEKDDLSEEFYFWLGLAGVGLCAGGDTRLLESTPVKGNLFLCLFGPTGTGKSRALNVLARLLDLALPYDAEDFGNHGVNIIPSPGSAEALVDSFSRPEIDEDTKKIIEYHPVRGLLQFDELATLVERSGRTGSGMKPILMSLYDSYRAIDHSTRGFGYVRAEGHFCTTITSTQIKAVRRLVDVVDVESGFLNRWVYVMGRDKTLDSVRRKRLNVDHLAPELQDLRAWARRSAPDVRFIEWDDSGVEEFSKFFHAAIEPMKKDSGKAIFARMDLTFKKIILLLAINEKREHITKDIVERALLLFPYLDFTYGTIGGEVGVTAFDDARKQIREVFDRNPEKPLSAREIGRGCRTVPIDLLNKVIRNMAMIGELDESVVKPSRGRPTTKYTYVR